MAGNLIGAVRGWTSSLMIKVTLLDLEMKGLIDLWRLKLNKLSAGSAQIS